MRFSAFSFTALPDIDTARQNFDLPNLSDKDVAKVLFHKRKQQCHKDEPLNWDQLRIGSISLVHYSLDYVEMMSYSLLNTGEDVMINEFFRALGRDGLVVSWNGVNSHLPLMNFRCMKHRVSHLGYWQEVNAGARVHFDVKQWFDQQGGEIPQLDDLSQRFGYPGMLGCGLDTAWDGYLKGDVDSIVSYSDFDALNAYLMALEVFALTGEMSHNDASRARKKLQDFLASQTNKQPRFQTFLDAWGEC